MTTTMKDVQSEYTSSENRLSHTSSIIIDMQ